MGPVLEYHAVEIPAAERSDRHGDGDEQAFGFPLQHPRREHLARARREAHHLPVFGELSRTSGRRLVAVTASEPHRSSFLASPVGSIRLIRQAPLRARSSRYSGASPKRQATSTATPSWSVSSAWVIARASSSERRERFQQLRSRGRPERRREREHDPVGAEIAEQVRQLADTRPVGGGERGGVDDGQSL